MPAKLTIDDLRSHLFETLKALRDKENPMDIDRAKAIADIGRVVVDSAKVEVQFLEATGALEGTGFLPAGEVPPVTRPKLAAAGTGRG
jgi:hypothetical protein